MGHLLKALIVSGFFTLAACSEAQFSSLEEASGLAKSGENEDLYNDEDHADEREPSPPLSEIPREELAEEISNYRCTSRDLARYGEEGDSGTRKVLICHLPPGNPSAQHNICVGEPAVYAHLNVVGRVQNVQSYLGRCQ